MNERLPGDTASEKGFVPFWFLNDRLEEQEMRRQIREMADAGIKGFFLHSRQGLAVPYLSEKFFGMIEAAIDEAESHGLEANLYDEFPYPSGVAGGEVLLGKPELHATRLDHIVTDVDGGEFRLELPRGEILRAVAYPLFNPPPDGVSSSRAARPGWNEPIDLRSQVGLLLADDSYIDYGLSPYSRKRFFSSDPVPTLDAVLPPGRYRVFVFAQVEVGDHKYWGSFADVLNPDAVREFLRLTHDRYAKRLGARLGRNPRSIFLDETAPVWSRLLPQQFWARKGYDLIESLPALVDEDHPEHAGVKSDFERVRYEMFCEAFEEPISRWCSEHSILYAGEKPAFRFAQLRYMDIPGCDPGHTKAGDPWDLLGPELRKNARAVASAAYLYEKRASLCECYHSLGWSATLQDARVIADALLLLGVDWIVPHGFFYSTAGLRKHDAPPSFFFQMPYWPLWHLLSLRVKRIGAAFAGTWIDARILVVDPNEGLPDERDRSVYAALLRRLLERHLEYLVCDADLLDPAQCRGGRLRVRDLKIEGILVPPRRAMEEELASRLDQLEARGLAVIRVRDGGTIDDALDSLPRSVRGRIEISGAGSEQLYSSARTNGKDIVLFIMNTTATPFAARLSGQVELREVPIDPDAAPRLVRVERSARYERLLGPLEACLIVGDRDAGRNPRLHPCPIIDLPVAESTRVEPRGPNNLRMYRWTMTVCEGTGEPAESARVRALPLANQLDEGGLRFRPRITHGFGRASSMSFPHMNVRYEYEFQSSYDGRVDLVMEPGSLVGDWKLRVNGERPFTADSFKPTEAHVRGSMGVDISSLLVSGKNRISIDLASDRGDGGLLNCLYLFGDFGVDPTGPALLERSPLGTFEGYLANGLPYYAGVIDYSMSVPIAHPPKEGEVTLRIVFPAAFEQACEISLNGGVFLPAPWSPYCVRVPATALRDGANDVTVRVSTSLSRSFEGQYFDLARHTTVDIPEP